MFKKALAYTGKYRKTTYAAIAFMIIGVAMTVVLFCCISTDSAASRVWRYSFGRRYNTQNSHRGAVRSVICRFVCSRFVIVACVGVSYTEKSAYILTDEIGVAAARHDPEQRRGRDKENIHR